MTERMFVVLCLIGMVVHLLFGFEACFDDRGGDR